VRGKLRGEKLEALYIGLNNLLLARTTSVWGEAALEMLERELARFCFSSEAIRRGLVRNVSLLKVKYECGMIEEFCE
jgi:hypothetical protein